MMKAKTAGIGRVWKRVTWQGWSDSTGSGEDRYALTTYVKQYGATEYRKKEVLSDYMIHGINSSTVEWRGLGRGLPDVGCSSEHRLLLLIKT
jgi:hypothetical protein